MDRSFGFLTVKEVAELLRLNIITIYDYIKDGRVPAVKFGRNYRISEKDLAKFIEDNLVNRNLKKINK